MPHTAHHHGVCGIVGATLATAHVQVGNETVDQLSWTRPEDITTPRSFYYNKLALNGASDLNGQIVGALASTAAVFKTKQPSLYDKYMNVALPLYGMAIGAYSTGNLCPLALRHAVSIMQDM
jgi:Glycosyl hydrolase family 9